jgi:hypothetical protein
VDAIQGKECLQELRRKGGEMSKNYPLHPGQTHAEPLYAQIPLEEYERLMKENGVLRKINKVQDEILERKMIAVVEDVNGGVEIIYMNKDGSIKRIEKR